MGRGGRALFALEPAGTRQRTGVPPFLSDIVARRKILVTQANWVHHRVTMDQAVIDVSPDNDWSAVRVFWPPSNAMGAGEYPAYGFIHAKRPASHDQLRVATPRAVNLALDP